MSKQKSNTVAALEQAQNSSVRVKENYRLGGLTSKSAIINEAEKSISASIRSGIKSLLINRMSDVNVDLLSITFVRSKEQVSENLVGACSKFTIVRNGEFINIPIDNYLLNRELVCNTNKVIISQYYTNIETFETVSDCQTIELFNTPFNYEFRLFEIFQKFQDIL